MLKNRKRNKRNIGASVKEYNHIKQLNNKYKGTRRSSEINA